MFGSAEDIQASVSGQSKLSFESLRAKDPQAELGAREHPKILTSYGGEYQSEKLEQMLAPIAGALVTFSNDPDRAYDITVLDSPTVNAFALPGGYLYVTRGLLALANDESEIAAVLAHEIAHVAANHGIERSRKAKAADLAERAVNEVVSNNVAGKVAKASTARRLSSFSQAQELQADAIGIKTIGKAGFDPFASARFLVSMKQFANWRSALNVNEPDMSSSHPSTPRRLELARRHARALGPEGSIKGDRERFLRGIDGLPFGDSPTEGFVRGNRFSHGKLNITFSVPQTFDLINRANAVLGSGPGETAIRFDAVAAGGKNDPAGYLASGWVNGLVENSIRAQNINGMKAANARALAGDWQFAITVFALNDRYFRFIIAAPRTVKDVDALGTNVAGTFRQMSGAERAALKPLRIKIITVRSGDTIAKLARKMQGVSRKVELFKALNELRDGKRPAVGSKVKLVTG